MKPINILATIFLTIATSAYSSPITNPNSIETYENRSTNFNDSLDHNIIYWYGGLDIDNIIFPFDGWASTGVVSTDVFGDLPPPPFTIAGSNSIPEPGSLALLLLGLAAAIKVQKRKS